MNTQPTDKRRRLYAAAYSDYVKAVRKGSVFGACVALGAVVACAVFDSDKHAVTFAVVLLLCCMIRYGFYLFKK